MTAMGVARMAGEKKAIPSRLLAGLKPQQGVTTVLFLDTTVYRFIVVILLPLGTKWNSFIHNSPHISTR